jgi:hypothetical protein
MFVLIARVNGTHFSARGGYDVDPRVWQAFRSVKPKGTSGMKAACITCYAPRQGPFEPNPHAETVLGVPWKGDLLVVDRSDAALPAYAVRLLGIVPKTDTGQPAEEDAFDTASLIPSSVSARDYIEE